MVEWLAINGILLVPHCFCLQPSNFWRITNYAEGRMLSAFSVGSLVHWIISLES